MDRNVGVRKLSIRLFAFLLLHFSVLSTVAKLKASFSLFRVFLSFVFVKHLCPIYVSVNKEWTDFSSLGLPLWV